MALHSKAHTDFRRSVAAGAKHSPPKRSKSKSAAEELALWAVLVVVVIVFISTLIERSC